MDDKLSSFNQKLKIAMGMNKIDQPKMTVNKLGEFLTTTSPKRQRSILETLKYPKEHKFAFTGYNEARKAIKDYVLNNFDEQVILDCISDFENKDDNDKDNFTDSTIKALTIVLESNNLSDSGYTFLPYKGKNPKLNIHGVEVSVYPDFIVHSETSRADYIGAAKIHLSKLGHFGEEGGKYISTMIYDFADKHVNKNGRTLRSTNCLSYDVFTDSLVESPKSIVRRWQDIEAGCKNIVAIWDSI